MDVASSQALAFHAKSSASSPVTNTDESAYLKGKREKLLLKAQSK
jgi:hypothetical protein